MAEASSEVQDDDQWLYGDEKDENKEEGEINETAGEKTPEESSKESGQDDDASKEKENEEGMEEGGEEEDKDDTEKTDEKEKDTEEDKPAEDEDSDDSDEEDLAITIGPLKKQSDVIQAPTTHPQKFQPKAAPTAGLKDEDFTTGGKVNGVPVADFKMDDFEDKPWRKPGADLSDYFNYGFQEESWFKYCERQKKMRISESGAGLGGLGIGVTPKPNYQPFPNNTSIPVSIVNDNSKYGMPPNLGGRKLAGPPPRNKERGQIDVLGNAGNKSGGNTIQVMTADRREYSNKIQGNQGPSGYDDNMDFGGNPYGNPYIPPPDPMYQGGGGGGGGYGGGGGGGGYNDQGWSGGEWEHGGGPGGGMPTGPPPPIMPPVSGPPMYFNNEDSMGAHSMGDHREGGDTDRQRPRRSGRSRSRSPSHRHRGERERERPRREHRSRSRSPGHRHKRKKSKRERDAD